MQGGVQCREEYGQCREEYGQCKEEYGQCREEYGQCREEYEYDAVICNCMYNAIAHYILFTLSDLSLTYIETRDLHTL